MGAIRAFTPDVHIHGDQAKSLWHGRQWWRRSIKAKDAATACTPEMHVLRVLNVEFRRAESENATGISSFMGKTGFDKPVKYTVDRDPVDSR